MEANDTMAVNAKTFRKIAKMIRRLVDHIRKEKSLSEKLAREAFDQIDDLAKEALLAKPRNCDVGTADEQARRMDVYCSMHGKDESGCYRCEKCKLMCVYRCELAWAQMPYEEGGAA